MGRITEIGEGAWKKSLVDDIRAQQPQRLLRQAYLDWKQAWELSEGRWLGILDGTSHGIAMQIISSVVKILKFSRQRVSYDIKEVKTLQNVFLWCRTLNYLNLCMQAKLFHLPLKFTGYLNRVMLLWKNCFLVKRYLCVVIRSSHIVMVHFVMSCTAFPRDELCF